LHFAEDGLVRNGGVGQPRQIPQQNLRAAFGIL
jgi:hypothetical protein